MSHRFSVFAMTASVVMMSALGAGCSDAKSGGQQPGQQGQPQTGPAWTLSLKSSCLDDAQEQCLAKYGFSVNADGKYQVGPGPQGQVRTGALAEADFAAVKAQLQTLLAAGAARSEQKIDDFEHVSNDTLTLAQLGQADVVVARNQGAELYYSAPSAEEAKSLHDAIRNLANNYYRMPFGNACGDAADKFAAAALDLTKCQTDADCAYVETDMDRVTYDYIFGVAAPSSQQGVLVEDCSAIKPVPAVNKLAFLGGAKTLGELHKAAREVCGNDFWTGYQGCQNSWPLPAALPSCVQNRCVARF